MKEPKKNQSGITLIALVISIIVMLILAGVSLNLTVGDNGIVTKAKESKTLTGLAVLQEQINYLKVEKMNTTNADTIGILDFSYDEYPEIGFLRRVNYGRGEIYVFDMNYIDRVSSNLKGSLSGGYGIKGSIYQLKDVYGINEDFTVWYRNEDGVLYGVDKIIETPIDSNKLVKMSQGLMESMGLTTETATVGNTRGVTTLEIDGSKMTQKITNLNDLSLMPNIEWLKLKDLTLDNVDGLQYLTQLKKITFNNSTVLNLNGLKFGSLVTGFYLINGSVTTNNMSDITAQFANMSSLNEVRIRNNPSLTTIPSLTTLGNIAELWIEENENLTNIYGLSTVKDKSHLTTLYLNENNLTDVVNTTDIDENYGYKVPIISDSNVINMSYLDGYNKITYLRFDSIGTTYGSVLHEDSTYDRPLRNNTNLHYLNGVKNGKLVGIIGMPALKTLILKGCDIYDAEYFDLYKDKEKGKFSLASVDLNLNKNLTPAQVNKIVAVMNKISFSLDGKYTGYLDTNKEELWLNNKEITDLSFLDGNTITTKLHISYNNFDDSQIKYIKGMTQLTHLEINNCSEITDFSFLANLRNLVWFSAGTTKITENDILLIPNKSQLTYLWLFSCSRIKSLDWISQFPNALVKDIRGFSIQENADLSVFNSRKMNTFLLNKGDLTTMQSAISNLNSEYGFYPGNSTTQLAKLENCTQITNLYMSSGTAEESNENGYAGENTLNLSKCTVLKKIYFKRNVIEHINITGCKALEEFTMYDMQRGEKSNMVDFSKNSNLKSINLDKNYFEQSDFVTLINGINPVYTNEVLTSGCPNLSSLYLNKNAFSSLEPLANLNNLNTDLEIYVANNQLVTISGIENLTNLKLLDISNNVALTNIQPILDLKDKSGNKLETVNVSGCKNIDDEMKNSMRNVGINVVE